MDQEHGKIFEIEWFVEPKTQTFVAPLVADCRPCCSLLSLVVLSSNPLDEPRLHVIRSTIWLLSLLVFFKVCSMLLVNHSPSLTSLAYVQ